jgi:hypothetical protein
MSLLCLDDQLSKQLGMVGLQLFVGMLTIPLSGVVGGSAASETALSSALDLVRERGEKAKSSLSAIQPVVGNIFTSLAKSTAAEFLLLVDHVSN